MSNRRICDTSVEWLLTGESKKSAENSLKKKKEKKNAFISSSCLLPHILPCSMISHLIFISPKITVETNWNCYDSYDNDDVACWLNADWIMRLLSRYLPLIMSQFYCVPSVCPVLHNFLSNRNGIFRLLAPSPQIHPFPTRHSTPFSKYWMRIRLLECVSFFSFWFCSTPFVELGMRREAVKCRAEFACVLIPESGESRLVTDVHDEMWNCPCPPHSEKQIETF